MRIKTLTGHDIMVYKAIYGWYMIHGPQAPTIRNIMRIVRSNSSSHIQSSIFKLEEIGVIEYAEGVPCSVRLVGEKWEIPPMIEFQVCGHPLSEIVSSDEGTHYCRLCASK